jgi:hypothetical protein
MTESEYITCERCRGMGEIPCPSCNSGTPSPSDWSGERCDSCQGERIVSCPDCGGSGAIQIA